MASNESATARMRASRGIVLAGQAARGSPMPSRLSWWWAHAGQQVVQLLQVGQDVDADLDVRLDHAVFLGGQRPGLLEHGVVDADLADVVEQAHQVEVAPLVGRHAQLLGEPDGDPRDSLGVARGVRVLGVDGRGQGADDAEEQLLQVGVEPGVGLLGGDQRGDRLEQLDPRRGERAVVERVDRDSQPVEPWLSAATATIRARATCRARR